MEEEVKIEDVAKRLGAKLREEQKAEFTSLKEEIGKSASAEEVNKILKKMEKFTEDLDGLSKKMNPDNGGYHVKSFDEQVFDALKDKGDELKEVASKKSASFEFEVKAPGTMLVRDGNGPSHPTAPSNYEGTVYLTQFQSGITRPERREPFLRQTMRIFSTSKPMIAYAELKNRDGAAGMTAEGAKKSQIDFDIVEARADVKKITAFVKVSKEMLDDVPYIRSVINQELVEAIELKLDEQLWEGDGAGNNLKGLLEYATALVVSAGTNPSFYQAVPSANLFDVLRVAQAILTQNYYPPTHAFVNPADKALMELTKDANGNYVIPPFGTANRMAVAGLIVVGNNLVEPGEFLIGDMTKSNLAIRENISISVGYENDDFTLNLVTILAEMRAGHFIKSNHFPAFVKGNFATIMAAINRPAAS